MEKLKDSDCGSGRAGLPRLARLGGGGGGDARLDGPG